MQRKVESERNEGDLPGDINWLEQAGEPCPPEGSSPPDETKTTTAKPKRKMKKERLLKAIADAVAHVNPLFPEFPNIFHVVRDAKGQKLYLEETAGAIVHHVDDERIIDVILKYSHEKLAMLPNAVIKRIDAKEAFHMWAACVNPIPQPAAFLQKSTVGLTFMRLPFDIQEDVDGERTTLFNELFSRISNSHALQCWIGSLMDPKSDRSQYVWLYGSGGAGKSALGSILMRVFGDAAISTQPPMKDDRFWSSSLVGKRFVLFPDCGNYGFVATGQFLSLTGDDIHSIEEKGKARTKTELNCKFMSLSNNKPFVSSSRADIRRAVYCEVAAFDGKHDGAYHEKLWEETPFFLGECWKAYRAAVEKDGKIIVCDNSKLMEVIEENELEHEELFDSIFEVIAHESCYPVSIMTALRERGVKDGRAIRRFWQYIESRGFKKVRSGPTSKREIRGLKLKYH